MDYLKVGDKQRPIYFGFLAYKIYEKKTGNNAFSGFANINAGDFVALAEAGFLAAAEYCNLEIDFTESDVMQWLDADDKKLVADVLEILAEAEGGKKKPKKASKPTAKQ